MRSKKLTADQIKNMRADYVSGDIRVKDLSEKYNISCPTLYNYCRDLVDQRPVKFTKFNKKGATRWSNEDISKMRQQCIEGASYKELAYEYDVSVRTVAAYCKGSLHTTYINDRNKQIKNDYINGKEVDELSEKYNLSESRIRSICSNLYYLHIFTKKALIIVTLREAGYPIIRIHNIFDFNQTTNLYVFLRRIKKFTDGNPYVKSANSIMNMIISNSDEEFKILLRGITTPMLKRMKDIFTSFIENCKYWQVTDKNNIIERAFFSDKLNLYTKMTIIESCINERISNKQSED